VGHTGTLDPFATGVLPLVVGRATRLARFFSASDKSYEAVVRFGAATTTYDATATPVGEAGAVIPTPDEIRDAVRRFTGRFDQVPPPFSAKKVGGDRAYDLARSGAAVRLAPVSVQVHRLEVLEVRGDAATLGMDVSAGFYVRSLAHDLGQALGCGAHLASLRRTASGEFGAASAVPLDEVERLGRGAESLVRPLRALLPTMPRVRLTADGLRRVRHGQTIAPEDAADWPGAAPGAWTVLMDDSGEVAALAVVEPSGVLHPEIVLL
jgi:tRNA pseudouridine55 synthase